MAQTIVVHAALACFATISLIVLLRNTARRMGLRIHGHLSETKGDVDFCLATYGRRPVQWYRPRSAW